MLLLVDMTAHITAQGRGFPLEKEMGVQCCCKDNEKEKDGTLTFYPPLLMRASPWDVVTI